MKVAMTGDLHFGEHKNSEDFSRKLVEFLDFMKSTSIENECDNICILGDIFHDRAKTGNLILNYAYDSIKHINNDSNIKNLFMLVGNHDIFYKNTRDVSALSVFDNFDKVKKRNDIFWKYENILFVNWICDETDWDEILNISDKDDIEYIFGHFEFNGFKFNSSSTECEDGYNASTLFNHFKNLKKIYTGHFHAPQDKSGVCYVGSPFPHNFSDVGNIHGFIILDTSTGEEKFFEYDKVQYHIIDYDEYKEGKIESLTENNKDQEVHIRLDISGDIEKDTMDIIRMDLDEKASEAKINYIPTEQKEILESTVVIDDIQDIDEKVIAYLKEVNLSEYEKYDNDKLIKFYKEAMESE